jgi:hypothetical protein
MSGVKKSSTRLKLVAALLVPAFSILGYLLVEVGYRGYLSYLYVFEHSFALTTVDARWSNQMGAPGSVYGFYQPRRPITFSFYTADGHMAQRHTVQINNYGWPSIYDYSREKPANEFRIAVIGDSMTASINNARPWPDVLQRNLNAD